MVKIVDGRKIAEEIKKDLKLEIENIEKKGYRKPIVANIWFKGNRESEMFSNLKKKACVEIGIEFESIDFPEDAEEKDVIEEIDRLNRDKDIDGISIQVPLPENVSMNIFSKINPDKDIESLSPVNIGRLIMGWEDILPCTPGAVIEILERENVDLKGKDVVIVNHSPIVGKPLSILFLNRNSTISVCHVYTKDMKSYTRNADILVSATGVPKLIKEDHIKEGAIVIDVGITKIGNKVVGDVDFEKVKEKSSIITPVPGGVGPVTIAMFVRNVLKLYRRRIK